MKLIGWLLWYHPFAVIFGGWLFCTIFALFGTNPGASAFWWYGWKIIRTTLYTGLAIAVLAIVFL